MTASESLSLSKRQTWAKEHAAALHTLLDSRPPKETPQRLFRTRFWADDVYTVVTLVHNISITPQPGQPDLRLIVFVTRPYNTPFSNGNTVATLTLTGQYTTDEIVAFLALDRLPLEAVEWVDETKYSNLVVVGDILKKLH